MLMMLSLSATFLSQTSQRALVSDCKSTMTEKSDGDQLLPSTLSSMSLVTTSRPRSSTTRGRLTFSWASWEHVAAVALHLMLLSG
ncbi:hypothetical protein F5883DRAFT_544143 [Diaporthe sp. PMI_573]|nr:hypothetical protein F5883DRAFT_544143 [Diaporthaceae sp. PMI_573]